LSSFHWRITIKWRVKQGNSTEFKILIGTEIDDYFNHTPPPFLKKVVGEFVMAGVVLGRDAKILI
jgi:hypothetical protein